MSTYQFDANVSAQVDVKEYFAGGGRQRRPLENPLAAEFGIYTKQDLDDFVLNHLPSFTLVRLSSSFYAKSYRVLLVVIPWLVG